MVKMKLAGPHWEATNPAQPHVSLVDYAHIYELYKRCPLLRLVCSLVSAVHLWVGNSVFAGSFAQGECVSFVVLSVPCRFFGLVRWRLSERAKFVGVRYAVCLSHSAVVSFVFLVVLLEPFGCTRRNLSPIGDQTCFALVGLPRWRCTVVVEFRERLYEPAIPACFLKRWAARKE